MKQRLKLASTGEQHKKQRKMLNPVFSLANMRAVLPTVAPIADKLLERIRAQLPEGGGTRLSSRFLTRKRLGGGLRLIRLWI